MLESKVKKLVPTQDAAVIQAFRALVPGILVRVVMSEDTMANFTLT